MNFWKIFIRLLPWRPRQALTAAYWHVTRRRVRARNRLLHAAAGLPITYGLWIANVEKEREVREAPALVASWDWKPRFCVVIHGAEEARADARDRSVRSVEAQIYPCRGMLAPAQGDFATHIETVDADFIVLLHAGDTLTQTALFWFAEALQAQPGARILYADEDRLSARGRRENPWFKPRWNAEMFLALDYVSSAAAIETSLAREVARRCGKGASLDELVLAATTIADPAIVHVPHVLWHLDTDRCREPRSERLTAIRRQVEEVGARCIAGRFGTARVQWPLPNDLPLVSIIVPTRDKLELLRPCVESVLDRTDYPNFELLIVDNGSSEARTKAYLSAICEHPRVRVLDDPGPYNFSAINNFAARAALGTYLCLLNNDTEVVEPGWLSEMMRYALQPHVGAVGAKLLYEDGTIQHAGVVVGLGGAAGHAHRFLRDDDPGYFRQAHVPQFVSAVTAACLVIEKAKYDAVGGLDEKELRIAFNDVDFCLKLQASGWRNVYVPHAVLLHHESKSRGSDMSPTQIDRYRRELAVLQRRWGTETYEDPLLNPNLDRSSETFVIGI